MRTTSSVESFNAVLNRSIDKHPDFFRLVMALKIHESRKTDHLFYTTHNDPKPDEFFEKKKIRDRERDKTIRGLTAKLNNDELNTEEFMHAMAKDENGKHECLCK